MSILSTRTARILSSVVALAAALLVMGSGKAVAAQSGTMAHRPTAAKVASAVHPVSHRSVRPDGGEIQCNASDNNQFFIFYDDQGKCYDLSGGVVLDLNDVINVYSGAWSGFFEYGQDCELTWNFVTYQSIDLPGDHLCYAWGAYHTAPSAGSHPARGDKQGR